MGTLTDRALEALLARAVARCVPDLCDALADAPVAPAEEAPPPPRRGRAGLYRAAAGLCACLALALGLGLFQFFRPAAVIGIEVNPGVELTANRCDRVLEVRALNADGAVILGDMDLHYLQLDVAVNALIGSMVRHGYIGADRDVAVLVSVSGGSAEKNQALQARVAVDIERAVSTAGGRAEVSTQGVTDGARPTPAPSPDPPPSPSPAPSPSPSPSPLPSPSPSPTPPPTPAPPPPDPVRDRPWEDDDDRDDDEDDEDDDDWDDDDDDDDWDDDDRDDDDDDDWDDD